MVAAGSKVAKIVPRLHCAAMIGAVIRRQIPAPLTDHGGSARLVSCCSRRARPMAEVRFRRIVADVSALIVGVSVVVLGVEAAHAGPPPADPKDSTLSALGITGLSTAPS